MTEFNVSAGAELTLNPQTSSDASNELHQQVFNPVVSGFDPSGNTSDRLVDTAMTLQDAITKGIPGSVAGGLDTILQTLGVIDDTEAPEILDDISKPLGNFYRENRDGLQTIGDIGFAFVPIIGATKLIRMGSILHRGFKKVDPTGQLDNILFSTGKSTHRVTAKARREMQLFARKGEADFGFFTGPIPVRVENFKAVGRNFSDILKEGIAADIGIWLLQGDSKTFFPEEMTAMENIALFGAFDFAFALGAGGIARHAIKKHIVDVAGPVAAFSAIRNSQGLAASELTLKALEEPNARYVAITIQSSDYNTLKQMRAATQDETELKNINAQMQGAETKMREIIGRMADDSPIQGLTEEVKLSLEETNTAIRVLKTDEGSFINVQSIEHFDPVTTPKQLIAKKLNMEKKAADQLKALSLLEALDDKAFQAAGGTKKVKELQQELRLLEETDAVVLEPGGGMVDLLTRKPIFQDAPDWLSQVKTKRGTTLEDKRFVTKFKDDDGFEREFIVTDNINIIIPEAKEQMTAGVPSVTLMPDVATAKSLKDFKLTLVDISEDWHYRTGRHGKPIYDNFPPEIRTEISNWTGARASSEIGTWIKNNDPRAQQIMHAYADAGLHQRLREVAHPDGTITLYRGMSKAEAKNPTNDVVSMAADPQVAKSFGGAETYTMRIPVDDVVMVIGGLRRETEYIVKGHTTRKLGEAIIRQDNFEALGLKARTVLFGNTQKAIMNYKLGETAKLNVGSGSHWLQLDAALEIAQRNRTDVNNVLTVPDTFTRARAGTVSEDDIVFASLREKFFEFDRLMRLHEIEKADVEGLLKIPEINQITIHDMIRMVNLPMDEAGGFAPIVQLMLHTRKAGSTGKIAFDAEFKNLAQVKEAMVRDIMPSRVGADLNPNLKFRGNMLSHPLDEQPVTLMFRDRPEGYITRAEVIESGILQREELFNRLMAAGPTNAPLVGLILGVHRALPDAFQRSLRVFELAEGSQFGRGKITQADFAARGNAVLQDISTLGDLAKKEAIQYVEAKMKLEEAAFNRIISRANEGDMLSYRMFVNAKNEGWELLDRAAVDQGDGVFHYMLKPGSKKNEKLWRARFKEAMPDGDEVDIFLPGPRTKRTFDKKTATEEYAPLPVSGLAVEASAGMARLGKDIWQHINFLAHAKGLRQIPFKAHHSPAADLTDKTLVFLVDDLGKIKRVVPGSNGDEAIRKANKEIAAMKEQDVHWSRITEDDAEQYFDMLREVWRRPEDFSNIRKLDGSIQGKLAEETLELGQEFFKNQIRSQARMYDSIFKETRALIYEPELNFAKQAKTSTGIVDTKKFGAGRLKARETVWDDYAAKVYQKGQLNANSQVGRAFFWAENLYDVALNKIFQAKVDAFEATKYDREFGTLNQRAAFQSLADTLGPYNPWTDLAEFVSRTTQIPTPPTLRKHTAALNKIVSFLALRLMDLGMPLINFTSLASTMPAVVRMMQRQAGETVEEFAKRTPGFGSLVNDDLAMWSGTRAVMSGMHYMFSKEGAMKIGADGMNEWQRAQSRGLLQQEIAERMSIMTAPTQGYLTRLIEDKAKLLSTLTDKSETLSRGIAYMTGLNLAKNGMGLGQEEAMLFAHRFANNSIADFRPSNRPQMFQGAVGLPLGLFTTFMWNFLQRIAGDIENKRWGALMTQAGMQFSLFGANSLPGFEGFVKTFTDNYDGSVNFTDGFTKRFGQTATDVFLNGSLSTIPLMFGADDGVAVMSRAQISTPFTAGPLAGSIPAWTTIKKVADTLRETTAMIKAREGYDNKQMAEILARYSLTRSYGNFIEWYQGYELDKLGQVIEADTQNTMGTASRIMGFSTLRSNQIAKEFARNRDSERRRARYMGELRQGTRSLARRTDLTKEEKAVEYRQQFNRYTKIGGDPADFGNYLNEQALAGTVEKVQLDAIRAAANSRRQKEAVRLIELTAPASSSFLRNQNQE